MSRLQYNQRRTDHRTGTDKGDYYKTHWVHPRAKNIYNHFKLFKTAIVETFNFTSYAPKQIVFTINKKKLTYLIKIKINNKETNFELNL